MNNLDQLMWDDVESSVNSILNIEAFARCWGFM